TTLLGITGLWMAILADTGATVLVTTNALRLLRWGGPATAAPRRQMGRADATVQISTPCTMLRLYS
ncbi:MAG: hypothetical protein ACREF3_06635, partial [Acetobacteraceae bacterium]